MNLGVTIAVIALLSKVLLDMGPWAAFVLAVMFLYINYLDNQVKLLRHELKVAKHDGVIDAEACQPAN